jgi:prepilin-type N-terminal cleavage/methylation domain-containing protein
MSNSPALSHDLLRQRRGFTLIELLVVLSIIAVLLGLLFPAISFVQGIAKKNKARALIAQIQGALNLYKDSQGTYPDAIKQGADPVNDPPLTAETPYPTNVPLDLTGTAVDDAAVCLIRALRLADYDTFRMSDSAKPLKQITDPWGKVVRYRPAKFYPFDTGVTKGHIDSAEPPNAQSYQLWSLGPNEIDDASLPTSTTAYGDDIVSWSK